ncbi:MAG: T9SS type A sorting domain-containing protein [Flavobacteriaceae bacterium]|nr:T9SS type A sorting domain-containing protein [Flavobacteriaceae bacterium]
MKKTIISLLVIFITTGLTAQTIFKLDSIHQYSWDDGMMDWRFDTRELYTYDNGGSKETNLLRLNWNGVNWENFYQFNKDYNGNNDLSQSIQQNWDNTGMTWQDSSRELYTYNTSNLAVMYQYAIWNGAAWMVFNDNQYAYDTMGNRIEDIRRDLNFATMILENSQRWVYNYSGSLLQDEIYQEWRDFLSAWENVEKKDYSYNGNQDVSLLEVRAWQTVSSDWSDPYEQSIFSYNIDELLEEVVEQIYGSGMWNNSTRGLNSYTNGNLTQLLGQEWNSGTTSWDNSFRQLRTFDVDDNEIELIYESWDDIGSAWDGFLRVVKFWSPEETLGVSFVELTDELKIYPNPVSHVVNINFKNPTASATQLHIYTVNGKLLVDQKIDTGSIDVKIPMVDAANGMLIMHLENNHGKRIYKLIKK